MTAFQTVGMHRGAHYDATGGIKFCLSVHLSVRSCTCAEHICFTQSPPPPPPPHASWSGGAGENVTSAGWELCSLSPQTNFAGAAAPFIHRRRFASDRRPSYHSFSAASDKKCVITHPPTVPLLAAASPPFKTRPRGEHVSEKRRWRTCYSNHRSRMKMFYCLAFVLTASAHGKLCYGTFLAPSFLRVTRPLSPGSEGRQTAQIMQKSQQARHMDAVRHTVPSRQRVHFISQ